MWTCSIFLLKFYLRVGPWFKFWETKPIHSAQCRHVVVCTHQIRRKRAWESLLKTIWALGITTIPSIKHESYTILTSHQTSSTSLPGLLLCWSKNYIAFFFRGLSCTKSFSNACFFSQFVVHQIVFYFVVPGLVCLLGNCCWWFLCNVCNLQSFMKILTIGSGTDKTWGLLLVFWIDFFVHQMVLKSVLFLI